MLTDPQRDYLRRVLVTMRIIVAALAMGVVFFWVVLLFIRPVQAGSAGEEQPMLSLFAAGAAGLAIVMSFVVPVLMAGPARQSVIDGKVTSTLPQPAEVETLGDLAPLAAVYMTRLIVIAAILEGAAFFNLIAYMTERQGFSLAIALVLVIFILMRFPTLTGVADWCERELKEIRQVRRD